MSLSATDIGLSLGARPVLAGAGLLLEAGRIVAIAGPNGAGKSTLLKVLAGLRTPDAGRVTLDGAPLGTLDGPANGRAIAYLPQERIVHWPVSARALVALGRLPHQARAGLESADDAEAIADAMRAMDVAQFASRAVTELSGGERARVMMARALSQGARFLLADEPTAGLDPAHALSVFEHFARLASEGRGIAVALHDLSLAARYCHVIVLMKGGRVVADGAPREVLNPERLAETYGIRATVREIEGHTVVLPFAPLT